MRVKEFLHSHRERKSAYIGYTVYLKLSTNLCFRKTCSKLIESKTNSPFFGWFVAGAVPIVNVKDVQCFIFMRYTYWPSWTSAKQWWLKQIAEALATVFFRSWFGETWVWETSNVLGSQEVGWDNQQTTEKKRNKKRYVAFETFFLRECCCRSRPMKIKACAAPTSLGKKKKGGKTRIGIFDYLIHDCPADHRFVSF